MQKKVMSIKRARFRRECLKKELRKGLLCLPFLSLLLILALYTKVGYQAIPCVVLIVDGCVTYAGAPNETFEASLLSGLEATAAK